MGKCFWVRNQKITLRRPNNKPVLKELRNRILHIILVWSLFSLTWVYAGLHFLQFILEN